MRPEKLNPLFAEAAALKGVGPGIMRALDKLGLTRVRDVAYHLPDRFVTRRVVADLDAAQVGEQIVVALTPVDYRGSTGRGPSRILASDAAGNICSLTYFGRNGGLAKKQLPLGERCWLAGRRACAPLSALVTTETSSSGCKVPKSPASPSLVSGRRFFRPTWQSAHSA